MNIDAILADGEGPGRTAALVEWIQSLFQDDEAAPVLVGGAAVELYTGGAYTTGDVDFVGTVTPGVARALRAAGFERHGRHWVHEPAQVFLEFPGSALDPAETAAWAEFEGRRIFVVSIEDLVVDRLGAWEHWHSSVDGVNALLLWRAHREGIDAERLERRVRQSGWLKAWRSLARFSERWREGEPPAEEVERWATAGP